MASGYVAELSFGQRQIRMAELLRPGQSVFAMPLVVRLSATVDRTALEAALQAVVRRHDALRSTFPMVDGAPVQAVADEAPLRLDIVTEAAADEDFDARIAAESQALVAEPFDLAAGPLVRATLLGDPDGEAVLIVVFHHIVADGASFDLFLRDLVAAYDDIVRGGDGTLPELPLQYPDYADWERQRLDAGGPALERSLAAWRARLEHAPAHLDLPYDRRRQSEAPASSAQAHVVVDRAVGDAIGRLARAADATEFNAFMAIFFAVLRRWSGLDDLVVTVPVSKRSRPELADVIGLLVDTLPIRVAVETEARFPALVRAVRDVVREAMEHGDIPFERIVQASGVERRGDVAPFMQILFGAAEAETPALTALDGARFAVAQEKVDQAAKADLSVVYRVAPDGLHFWCRYDAAVFDAVTIERLLGWMARFAESVAAEADQPVLAVPLIAEEEGRDLVARFNATARPYERDSGVPALFFEAARRNPDATAIEEQGFGRTYRGTADRVRRLAAALAAAGVEGGDIVLLVLPVSAALIEMQLAVLALGAAYAPVDPTYPAEQREARARLVAARLAVVEDGQTDGVACPAVAFADLLARAEGLAPLADRPIAPESLAYVMFTSGSTGQPKGVGVPHRAIVRLVRNTNFAGFGPSTRSAVYSNPAFDASTLEIWAPLLNGGTAVPVDRTIVMDPRALRLFLSEARIDLLWITAGLFQQIAAVDPLAFAGDRTVLTGGDVVNPAAARAVLEAGRGSGLRLLDGYGPTENTTFSTTYDIAFLGPDEATIPIGRPIANSTAYVLDPAGKPLPPGIVGEIWVGGDGVALGYLGDPVLTEARFQPDPFAGLPNARMYRTGDLGRWREDGTIVFVGRADHQVKVRGYRVELGEISAALALHPNVAEAIVVAPRREGGDRDLVAYVTPRNGASVTAQDLRAFLEARLPKPLLPHAFVVLERFPLNANGKVDTRALPSVELADFEHAADRIAPRTPEERLLAGLWADLLGRPVGSVDDNFFHVGGDSILTIRLVARAYEAGLDFGLKDVFDHPTIEGLAAIAARRSRARADTFAAAVHPADLLPAASRPGTRCRIVSLTTDRSVAAVDLGYAIQRLAERHDALRLLVVEDGASRRLSIADFLPAVPVRFVDLPAGAADDLDAWIAAHRSRLVRGIDLAQGVTIAATLIKQAGSETAIVVLALHEAIADDRALLLIATELESALAAGPESARLPVPALSFSEWLSWLADYAESEPVRRAAIACEQAGDGRAVPPFALDGPPVIDCEAAAASTLIEPGLARVLAEDLPARLGISALDALAVALGEALGGAFAIEIVDGRRTLPAAAPRAEGLLANLDAVLPLATIARDSAGGEDSLTERLRAAKITRQEAEPLGLALRIVGSSFTFAPAAIGLAWLPTAQTGHAVRLHHAPAFSGSVHGALVVRMVAGRLELRWIGAAPDGDAAALLAAVERAIHTIAEWARRRTAPVVTPQDFPLAALEPAALARITADAADLEDLYPLSPMQEAMLLHSLSQQGSSVNFEQSCMRFRGRLDVAAFRRAWAHVFERHPVLRTTFRWRGLARPLQVVRRLPRPPVAIETWPSFNAERLERRLAEDRAQGFDLEVGPLARLVLIRVGETDAYLIASFHHVLVDGWCLAQLEREARAAYEALRRGINPQLEPVAPFRDFIAWSEGVDRAEMGAYFKSLLAAPPAQPALRRPSRGAAFATVRHQLGAEDSKALADLSRRRGITIGALAHLAWGLWSAAKRGIADTVFCTTVSGRPPQVAGVERMVGLFINNLPVRLRFADDSAVSDLAAEMQRQIAALQSHAQLSLIEVGEAAGVIDRAPSLFDTLLVVENMPSGTSAWSGANDLVVESVHGELKTAYSVTCVVVPGDRVALSLVLPDPDGTAEAEGAAMIAEVAALLAALPKAIDRRVADLPLPKAAAPRPASDAPTPSAPRAAPLQRPRDGNEAIVLDVITAVAGFDIGTDDDFLAAGLTSLGLATAAARIGERLKRHVPVTLLIEHRTGAALARALAEGQAWDAVVPLKGGTGEPFVCVHPIAGDVSAFLDLARAMPGDRPFWALQAPGLEEGQEPIGRVEDLAAYNLAALARRGLPAPRLLGGYSFGGVVAFEMARQLAARGMPPERLVIIDTPAPVGVATSILSDDADFAHAQWLVRMADVRARHHGTDRPFEIEDLLPLRADERFAFAVSCLGALGLLPEGADTAWLMRAHHTGLVLYRAFLDYRAPADPHSQALPLRLVRASTVRHGDLGQSELAVVEAPAMGWERVVRVPISVESVPGDHISMLDVRRVLLTADVIGRFLGS